MAPTPFRALLVLLLSTLALACGHKIGDECQTSVDCSQGGERLCDITQPGGYCTQFNCEPGTCPDESSCIAFGAALSTAPVCRDMSGLSRLQRSFCMLSCSSDGDCRGGYTCQDLAAADNAWRNALPIDPARPPKVCLADFEKPGDSGASGAASVSTLPSPNVCTGPSAAQAGSGGASSGGASSGGASSAGASSAGASSAGASSGATSGVGGSDGGSSGEGASPDSAGAGGNGG